MGGKLRIAPYISQYINDIAFNENISEYYEPFMGGCSVGEQVHIKNRHLSDINEHIVEVFKQAQSEMWEYECIDRDTWYKIKDDRFKYLEVKIDEKRLQKFNTFRCNRNYKKT